MASPNGMAAGRTVMWPQALALKWDEFESFGMERAPCSLMQRSVTLVIGEVEVGTKIAEHLPTLEDK